jgi:hypothetical protein
VREDRVDRALDACRVAVGDYQAGLLDDRGLRMALLDAAAVVEDASVHVDRIVRAAVALPMFTEQALHDLRRWIDRMTAVVNPGRTP